jgi:3-hydroxyacyl-[acyl-carrier-protein] dehydratase
VLSREPGVSASADFAVSAGSGYFPPLLLVESMAQLGGIAAGQRAGEGGVLAALAQVELPAAVLPGTRYSVYSRVVKVFGHLALVEGEVREDGTVVARATLTLGLGGYAD